MKLSFVQKILHKIIATQLSKPTGLLAGKVGKQMNKVNNLLYDFTITAMELKDKESILEIGFGNGKFFNQVFAAADNLAVSGLEFSPEMLKAARANNRAAVSSGKLNLVAGSSEAIPFADNSFDKIFCINVIYFWQDPDNHLKEIYRVLKPGGKFYTTIRTKESMEQMPFTAYGFNKYEQAAWEDILTKNHLTPVNTLHTKEEIAAFTGKGDYAAAALCVIAQK